MAKFKVGDKVRRIKAHYRDTLQIGSEVVITRVDASGAWVSVDNNGASYNPYPCNSDNFELIEEPEMTQQFKAMKIHIKDEQHSRLVQETLFEMGYRWECCGENVLYTNAEVLWADDDGFICKSSFSSFNDFPNEEVELITTYSFHPVDQEVKRKREEKEALEKNVAEMQKQLDEMKQKLEKM